MEFKSMVLGVVGTGQMGRGLVQFLSVSPAVTRVHWKATRSPIDEVVASMRQSLMRDVDAGRVTHDKAERALSKILPAHAYEDLADCQVVHEVVAEDLQLKLGVIRDLDPVLHGSGFIATNTSALSITELSSATLAPGRVLGMHFFNPVGSMKLVELVPGNHTSASTLRLATEYANALGKKPVVVQESPGFVVNRILIPMINEAVFLLAENVADRDSIDTAMKFGANHLIGPLALADLIGTDVVVAILDALLKATGDPKFRAHPLLREMARVGKLGKKTGRGFYEYS